MYGTVYCVSLVKSSQPKPDLQFLCWNKNGLREIGKARIVLVAIKMRLPAVVAVPDFEKKKRRKKRTNRNYGLLTQNTGQDVFPEHPIKGRNFGERIRQISWKFLVHTQCRCCATFHLSFHLFQTPTPDYFSFILTQILSSCPDMKVADCTKKLVSVAGLHKTWVVFLKRQ